MLKYNIIKFFFFFNLEELKKKFIIKMKNITKYIGNVSTTILTIMSIDSYRRVLESEYTDENINNLVEETVRRSKEIIRKLDDQAIQTNDIENQLGKFKDCL